MVAVVIFLQAFATTPSAGGSITRNTAAGFASEPELGTGRLFRLDNDYIVSVGDNGHLMVFDVSTPLAPTLAAELTPASLPTFFNGLGIIGNLFITEAAGAAPRTFHIYDLTTPTAPTYTGSATSPFATNNPGGYASDGSYLWAAIPADDQIAALDFTSPLFPSILTGSTLTDATQLNSADLLHVAGDGNLYVGNSSFITAVDITPPTSPTILDRELPGFGGLDNIFADVGTTLITAGAGIAAWDISNPAALNNVDNELVTSAQLALAITDDHIVYPRSDQRYGINNIATPAAIGAEELTAIHGLGTTTGIVAATTAGYAYAIHDSVLHLINVNTLAVTEAVLALTLSGPPSNIVAGRFACTTGTGIALVDPSVPGAIGRVSDVGNGGAGYDGTYVVVADSVDDAVRVLDFTTPSSPSLAGSVVDGTLLNNCTGIAFAGGYAWTWARDDNRIAGIDYSTPATPTIVGSVQDATDLLANFGGAITADGDYVYVTVRNGGRLTVVDVSTPATPVVAGSIVTGAFFPEGIAYAAGYCYVLSDGRVDVVDVSTPATPVVVNTITDATQLDDAFSAAVIGDLLVVYCTSSPIRLTTIDITDPLTATIVDTDLDADLPAFTDNVPTPNPADGRLYIPAGFTPGVVVYDSTQP